MKAGSPKPAHKKMVVVTRGAREAGSPGLLRSDPSVCVREAPGASGVAVSTTATKANSQPQGAPDKGPWGGGWGVEGGAGHTQKNSLYESLFLNQ